MCPVALQMIEALVRRSEWVPQPTHQQAERIVACSSGEGVLKASNCFGTAQFLAIVTRYDDALGRKSIEKRVL